MSTEVTELLAHLDEAETLIAGLRRRVVTLNVMVRERDATIAELQASAQDTKGPVEA